MQHSFDVRIAEIYGILPAIILNNLQFWIEKNKANDMNFYDGTYWTYNSIKAFKEMIPYASEKQIRTALNKLQEEGLIMTGNYNKSAYDRTMWYAITELGKSILQDGNFHLPCRENEIAQEGEPIPDINTDINTDIIPDNKKEINKEREESTTTSCKNVYEHIKDMFNDTCVSFPRLTVLSESRKKMIKARLNKYSIEQVKEMFAKAEASDFLKGANNRNWRASFDWLMKDSNFPKVLEGNYDNKESPGTSAIGIEWGGTYL